MKKFTKVRRLLMMLTLVALIAVVGALPAFAAPVAVVNMAGTWIVRCSVPVHYVDGTDLITVKTATLTITDNTTNTKGVIGTANIAVTGIGTVALVGFVGAGTHPRLSLIGSDGITVVNINAKVSVKSGLASSISGRIDGWAWHSGGALGDDPVGAAATWSVADSYNGSVSALLTQAAAPGSTYVQVTPPTGITLGQLSVITTGWSFWHNLQDGKAYGPQVELRFAAPTNVNPDGAGHVDITLIPHQEAGDGTWEQELITGAASVCGYYGNDPWDGTAFDEFSGTILLQDVETAINSEGAMTANASIASNWTLTRVRVELWEAGARTCYVDDLVIKGHTYTFEPVTYAGSFKAHK